MPNLTVAVLGEPGFAKDLGKTGTSSDITLYNLKRGTDSVTFIEPTRYPEKVAPLFFAVSLADRAILVVGGVDAAFGETVLMLQCAGVAKGHLVLRNYLTREQLLPLIRGTVVEGYEVFSGNPGGLRDSLLDEAAAGGGNTGRTGEQGPGTVPVDHFFPVKGIGTVVLGTVASGEIHPHDTLQVLPLKRQVQVRSIQKLDDDAEIAVKGDRVGLALKGIEAEELDRGYVLTNDPGVKGSDVVSGRIDLVPYWKVPLKEGMMVHAGHWMQFVPGRIEAVDVSNGDRRPQVTIRLDREIVHPPGARAILHHLEGGSLRIIGCVRLP
ncbi:MAG TPA: EF-Tu/IF-2/RF-3 family GTPase [Methanomicrobiales archaeon]|nr:EF-Tu/IF-2/RF-3 family GTPase [Methanomicrobiales archaeon]